MVTNYYLSATEIQRVQQDLTGDQAILLQDPKWNMDDKRNE
jgi:hypothetical protein